MQSQSTTLPVNIAIPHVGNADDSSVTRTDSGESWGYLEEADDFTKFDESKSISFSGKGSPLPRSPLRNGIRQDHNDGVGQWLDTEILPLGAKTVDESA
mmetsp:Transcript_12890/g.30695  ORF Transcript_12890/g.30695 Transcript_12890/m.30695 type:complete len:99 (-) Transcript_12890:95-391(-)|eukprot:1980488-Rhodomonas_salina.1